MFELNLRKIWKISMMCYVNGTISVMGMNLWIVWKIGNVYYDKVNVWSKMYEFTAYLNKIINGKRINSQRLLSDMLNNYGKYFLL